MTQAVVTRFDGEIVERGIVLMLVVARRREVYATAKKRLPEKEKLESDIIYKI